MAWSNFPDDLKIVTSSRAMTPEFRRWLDDAFVQHEPMVMQPCGKDALGDDPIRVADYAAGDGVSNATLGVQSALSLALAEGKDCYLSAGTYLVTNITVDGVRLYGPGTLKWSTSAPADQHMITLAGGGKLDGIRIDCDYPANAAKSDPNTEATIFISEDGAHVVNCFVTGAPGAIINGTKHVADVLVANNYFRNTPQRYGVVCKGRRWRIQGNLFVGVLGYCVRVGLFGGDGVGSVEDNVVSGNVVYASRSSPFHVELYAKGTIIESNISRHTASAIKIQYQPGEPVYGTIVSGNVFSDSLYTGTWDDATGVWTPDTSSQWGASGIGGYGTVVVGNQFIGVTGLHLYNESTIFQGNYITNAGDNSMAIVRVQSEARGAVVSGNHIQAADGYTSQFFRADATDVTFADNHCTGGDSVANLVSVQANNCAIVRNKFNDCAGTVLVGSSRQNTSIVENVFTDTVANPLSDVSTLSVGTMIRWNKGSVGAIPNLNPTVTVSGGAITMQNMAKARVSTGGAATANLSTISGGQPGDVIQLTRFTAGEAVTLVTGGNISLEGGASYLLGTGFIVLVWNGGTWVELRRE